MTQAFVSSLLMPVCRQLQHVETNNLMQWSDTIPPLPHCEHIKEIFEYANTTAPFQILERTRLMAGALEPMIDHCSNLTSVRISTVGQFGGQSSQGESREDRMYKSWARLLSSRRDNLHELFFEQGVSFTNFRRREQRSMYDQFNGEMRPMDRLFVRWVLPVLLEAPWPSMERMDIRGVGRYTRIHYQRRRPLPHEMSEKDVEYDFMQRFGVGDWELKVTRFAFPQQAKDALRELVGGATFIIEEEVERDYEDLTIGDIGLFV
jgi:hypothetical protein